MSTETESVTRAVAKFDAVAAGIGALSARYAGVVYPVETTKGMEEAKKARLAIREPRYELERLRKDAKAPILALGKQIDSEAARITAELLKLEDPIDQQIKLEEARKEAERAAKVEAERLRVEGIQHRIQAIRDAVNRAAVADVAGVAQIAQGVEAFAIDDSLAEFSEQAAAAKADTLEKLGAIYTAAVAREAEAARLKTEREELAKQRAEQEARDKAERARIAEEERQAKAERDRLEAEAAERRQAEEVDLQRQRDEIATQQAELERQRQAAMPKPPEPPAEIPVRVRPKDVVIRLRAAANSAERGLAGLLAEAADTIDQLRATSRAA